jgi:prolyl oligopeptidase
MTALDYPPADRTDKVDTFHGVPVADPYAWLGSDTPATRAWLHGQAALTDTILSRLPDRTLVDHLVSQLPDCVPDRLPVRQGGRAFVFGVSVNGGASLVRSEQDGTSAVVFDPADVALIAEGRLSPEFTYVSPDGRHVAVGLTQPGTDWSRFVVWDIDGRRLLAGPFAETAHPVVAWRPDGSGFYYNITLERFGRGEPADGVWFHDLREDPALDRLVFDHRGGHGHAALPIVLANGVLLVKTIDFVSQEASLWLVDGPTARLLLPPGPRFNLIGESGPELVLETQVGASRGRVVALDPRHPKPALRELVAESDDSALAIASHSTWSPLSRVCGGRLFLTCIKDAAHRVRVFSLDGSAIGELAIPSPCTVLEITADGAALEVGSAGFLRPWSRFSIDPTTLEIDVLEAVGSGLPIDDATTEQIFCNSSDGVRVPAFIVRPPGDPRPRPTLLYVYGGWGQSVTPSFRPDLAVWVAMGGAYAVANTRGGGEYGEPWHRAGMRLNKINTFADCCAVAEFLVDARVAGPDQLCIRGLSNGGLVVAACINRRPDLFAAASCMIPLVDVVHLMDMPAGSSIAAEFGDPTADRETFDYLLSYSPLQNVRHSPVRPDLLIIAGETDERAPPAWAYRYVAELQATTADDQVVLLRVVPGEAHGGWPQEVEHVLLGEQIAFLWARAVSASAPAAGES